MKILFLALLNQTEYVQSLSGQPQEDLIRRIKEAIRKPDLFLEKEENILFESLNVFKEFLIQLEKDDPEDLVERILNFRNPADAIIIEN